MEWIVLAAHAPDRVVHELLDRVDLDPGVVPLHGPTVAGEGAAGSVGAEQVVGRGVEGPVPLDLDCSAELV